MKIEMTCWQVWTAHGLISILATASSRHSAVFTSDLWIFIPYLLSVRYHVLRFFQVENQPTFRLCVPLLFPSAAPWCPDGAGTTTRDHKPQLCPVRAHSSLSWSHDAHSEVPYSSRDGHTNWWKLQKCAQYFYFTLFQRITACKRGF